MIRIHEDVKITALSVAPKTDMNKVQRLDNDGLPQWSVSALHMPEDGSKPELVTVTVAKAVQPVIIPMKTGFENLELGFYNVANANGGNSSGLYFRASGLVELDA